MQRGFGDKNCPKNAKIYHSKTLEKSINSCQTKFFLKKSKKSVAKIVRFFDAYSKKIALMRGDRKLETT